MSSGWLTLNRSNNVGASVTLRETGRLGDLAPTLLDLLSVNQPEDMTGESLIQH